MKRISLLFAFTCLVYASMLGQMISGIDTLYGNEWINFDQTYYRFQLAEDGIYRIDGSTLNSIVPPGTTADQLRLFYFGEEIPIYTTTTTGINSNDYIEFFGQRNRTELDQYLFKDPDLHFHPDYSLFTDTSSYYLTWTNSTSNQRYDVVQNDLNNLPPAESYLWYDNYTRFTEASVKKSVNIGGANVQNSVFADAEGFCDGFFGGTLKNKQINFQEVYPNGPEAHMTVRYAARSGDHHQQIYVNGTLYVEDIFTGYVGRVTEFDVPAEECLPSTTFTIEGIANSADKQTISVIHTSYPRTMNMLGLGHFQFDLEASIDKKYYEFENFLNDGVAPILYDITNTYKLETSLENGIVKFVVPPSLEERTIVVLNPISGFKTPSAPEEMNFIDYTLEDAEFVILTNPTLREGSTDWVAEYAQYRSQESPTTYTTYIVHIDDIYDQFGYGVVRHSQSVRNFAHYVDREWTDLQYFFLIGKGREYKDVRLDWQVQQNYNSTFFIPTYGHPGSDHMMFANNLSALPIVPVGRLAAKNSEEVRIYLEKVKQFENQDNLNQTFADRAWMKRVMHLGGGGDGFEQNQIRTSLRGMEDIIEQNRYGGEVTSFFKTSTDPIETSQSAALKNEINNGVSILTFFGHSSPNIFDFNFDDPNSYENTGRYPLLFSMGCFSGNCHTDNTGIGERFILEDQKGAVAYVGSTGYGFISALDVFGDEFYTLAGTTLYGETIGKLIYESSKVLDGSPVVGESELAQQTTYQGDPALRLYPQPGPDYVVDNRSVSFNPSLLNLQVDSFDLNFTIGNIGRHIPDTSFTIKVEQQLPNGQRLALIEQEIEAPAFSRDMTLRLPMQGPEAIGFNRFFIEVDVLDEISELPLVAESNNRLTDNSGQEGIGVFIVSNDIRPIYPPEFSIVSDPSFSLKASSLNAFAEEQTFLIQLDTSATFSTPIATGTAQQIGGVFQWKPSITLENERVYYWRVSPEDVDNIGYRWQNSSFVYVEDGPNGWNQSHYYQFEKDELVNMELLPTTRRLDFIDDIIDIKTRNVVLDFPALIPRYYRGSISQLAYASSSMTNSVPAGLLIGVLDTINVEPLLLGSMGPVGSDFGGANQKGWLFKTDTEAQRAEVINFLENEVPDRHYVVFMTVQRSETDTYLPEEWAQDSVNLGTNIFQVLESQGANMIRSLETLGPLPYSR
ncbi:MAG: C25 family cysteine peptidase, partial [Bacteroidota bacterium]